MLTADEIVVVCGMFDNRDNASPGSATRVGNGICSIV